MPNWVTTTFTVDGKDSDKLLKIIRKISKTKSKHLFETIMGYPKTFRTWDTTNNTVRRLKRMKEDGCKSFKDDISRKTFPLTDEVIARYKNAADYQKRKYGVVGWYDFNCKYFGTKWDACDIEVDGDMVTFLTAWSFPEPFFRYLADHYDITIRDGEFDDEGNFYGDFQIFDGELNVWDYDGDRWEAKA